MIEGFFKFTHRERRGILYLIPLVVVIALLALLLGRQRPLVDEQQQSVADSVRLFAFDPNTVDLRGLMALGFTKREASGILSYRERGKRFATSYDFAECYQVSVDMFERLKDSIVIAPGFRAKEIGRRQSYERTEFHSSEPPEVELHPFDPNRATEADFKAMGFSLRQASAIVKYRTIRGGFRSPEEFAECYVVSPQIFARLAPYIAIEIEPVSQEPEQRVLVELNGADSATLCSVRGIGSVTAGRIVAYRKMLGGYAHLEQLSEVRGVSEANFERILQEISLDSCRISKIDVNFATPEIIGSHPYMRGVVVRKLLKNRQLKGGWRQIEDMVKENIITAQEAQKLRPYLVFTPLK